MRRPHGNRIVINPDNPRKTALCQRCGSPIFRHELSPQKRWSGTKMLNTGLNVCDRCLDIPNTQEQLILLPPDPYPALDGLRVSFPMDMVSNYSIYPTTFGSSLFGLNSYMSGNGQYSAQINSATNSTSVGIGANGMLLYFYTITS